MRRLLQYQKHLMARSYDREMMQLPNMEQATETHGGRQLLQDDHSAETVGDDSSETVGADRTAGDRAGDHTRDHTGDRAGDRAGDLVYSEGVSDNNLSEGLQSLKDAEEKAMFVGPDEGDKVTKTKEAEKVRAEGLVR